MGWSKRILLPTAEDRQAKVCDSTTSGVDEEGAGVAAGSVTKRRSARNGRVRSKVVRPLVKLKDSLVGLVASSGGDSSVRGVSRSPVYISMGVIMAPVDLGGYEAASYYSARSYNSNYN